MFGKKKKKQPESNVQEFLRGVPVVPQDVETARNHKGELMLKVAVARAGGVAWPISLFVPPISYKQVQLDMMGAEVFKLCDGKRTVERIIDQFAENHKLTFRESQISVTSFLHMLVTRNMMMITASRQDRDN